jgi:hypothetical protein
MTTGGNAGEIMGNTPYKPKHRGYVLCRTFVYALVFVSCSRICLMLKPAEICLSQRSKVTGTCCHSHSERNPPFTAKQTENMDGALHPVGACSGCTMSCTINGDSMYVTCAQGFEPSSACSHPTDRMHTM